MPYARHENADEHIRVQPLVSVGGAAMAFIAGYVNASMLEVYNVPVSHMSGAVSRLGIDVGQNKTTELSQILQIVLFFVLGCVLSGFIIGSQSLKPGRQYAIVFALEGLILALAAYLLGNSNSLCVPFAAMACGMQNAMASSYYGLIIRTTHLTGILTDLGVLLGHALRYREIKWWKIGFLSGLVAGFFLGSLSAILLKEPTGGRGLWVAAGMCFCASVIYLLLLKKWIRREAAP